MKELVSKEARVSRGENCKPYQKGFGLAQTDKMLCLTGDKASSGNPVSNRCYTSSHLITV